MSLIVQKPGLYTTVQDRGRNGHRAAGLTGGGAMDDYALRVANLLVGNEEGEAGLELTLTGPVLRAEEDLLIAITGADMAPHIDGHELATWRPVFVPAGATIRFGAARLGCRAYVAVAGGIGTAAALGSRSTDARARLGGIDGRPLRAGDAVPCGMAAGAVAPSPWATAWLAALAKRSSAAVAEGEGRPHGWAAWYAPPQAYGGASEAGIELRVMPGSEHGQYSEAARAAFYSGRYRVQAASDRMGVRLDGSPPLERIARNELLSHGIVPGVIQVPDGGQPIILAADCQTTGGYPKLAHVAAVDMPLLAQAKPGDWITFRPIGLDEAHGLYLATERSIRALEWAIRCRLPRDAS
ncbi:antagonist of KipI [Paenibacillus cellulosilyticus]|uniref:Antagonist of KipI n=1 Tax=Paenibacillus cellulosilyticus TaxID=375489 RepID=A0A2V2YYU2_9BACL|nr:biotin-dependent carboxyltransferase family protein [Paenibacillus cellulosilyticus]PWW07433.1 antagonist of KipI [Paenibacillus cellulosilyticus]QKS44407.1 biotin-dependent carboxyltransferase family protein [Paenibacillus cellulosilyticus]